MSSLQRYSMDYDKAPINNLDKTPQVCSQHILEGFRISVCLKLWCMFSLGIVAGVLNQLINLLTTHYFDRYPTVLLVGGIIA